MAHRAEFAIRQILRRFFCIADRPPSYHVGNSDWRMTYPKQVTEQPLAAARERLRAANINPDGEVYAENMAFMILEGTYRAMAMGGTLRKRQATMLAPMQPCRIAGAVR